MNNEIVRNPCPFCGLKDYGKWLDHLHNVHNINPEGWQSYMSAWANALIEAYANRSRQVRGNVK